MRTTGTTTTAATFLSLVLLAGCAGSGTTPPGPRPAQAESRGLQPDRDRTGATGSVTPEQLGGQHVASVEEMLQGRVAGLQVTHGPGGEIQLRIRGGTPDLMGGSWGEPLLIIDGMPIQSGNLSAALRGLNPFEVERIDVLKDASSTAIYGTRGAHGVILIALKRDR